MAPTVETQVVLIFPWPHFQSFIDNRPNIGGRLWTWAANTTTPKAAYADPALLVPLENPILLNDQGARDIWLNGTYHLRLEDVDGVELWDILSYTFTTVAPAPDPGGKIVGSSDAEIVTTPGAGVISVPGLVPAGYRCEGLTWTITTGFGTSSGLTGLLIGDAVANDRWARLTDVSTGQTGGQVNFRSDTTPVEPIPYVILVAAEGGTFDATGALHVTAYWSALPSDTP